MTLKEILLLVDDSIELSNDILNFTPIEKALMLKIGSETIIESKKLLTKVTHEELEEKIKKETNKLLEKKEIELLVKDELIKKTEERIMDMYNTQISLMEKKMETLQKTIVLQNEQLGKSEAQYKLLMLEEVNKEKERNKLMLEEKDRQISRFNDVYEKLMKQNETKSSKKLGDKGEDYFIAIAEETFKDFQGYKMERKSTQGHRGDVHLFFNEFNVLVDLKNYTTLVRKKDIEKIEEDLVLNKTMDFAWLISLETNVSDWNRFPIMYKWIVTDVGLKCIIIVNNLNSNANIIDTLRNIWNTTNEMNKLINNTKVEDKDIELLKERDFNLSQQIKKTQKKVQELKRNVTMMSQVIREIETDLLESLSRLSDEIIKKECDKNLTIKEWWTKNITYDESNTTSKLSSTEIWNKFKKDNKEYVESINLTSDEFKSNLKKIIDEDKYIEKSKKGALEFIGFNFISLNVNTTLDEQKINLVLDSSKVSKLTK